MSSRRRALLPSSSRLAINIALYPFTSASLIARPLILLRNHAAREVQQGPSKLPVATFWSDAIVSVRIRLRVKHGACQVISQHSLGSTRDNSICDGTRHSNGRIQLGACQRVGIAEVPRLSERPPRGRQFRDCPLETFSGSSPGLAGLRAAAGQARIGNYQCWESLTEPWLRISRRN